ncbi:hypothetical protein B7494_g5424 [Chlorociboria aeruginascens]|nr:hypothetical protein B7494_g5424 [Chlorociboria aeruginascens]
MVVTRVPVAPPELWLSLQILHYAVPAVIFGYFILALSITICTLQTKSLRIQDQHVRRNVVLSLILSLAATYVAESIVVLARVVVEPNWSAGQDRVFYLIASALVYGTQALALTDAKFPVWYPYYGTWFIGILAELTLHIIPTVFRPPRSPLDFVFIVIQMLRIVNLIVIPTLFFGFRNDPKKYDNADAERQSLLSKTLAPHPGSEESTLNGGGYGATADSTAQDSDDTEAVSSETEYEDSWLEEERKAQELINKRLKQDGNWWTYAKGFTIFFPYVWPLHSKKLQFRAVLVGVCLLASNAFNVLIPNQMGVMVDRLKSYVVDGNHDQNVWLPVAVYAILLFVSGGACIGWIQKWLWIPLEQYSYDALSTAAHSHIMNLSSDFHDNKNSSDLNHAVSGGRSVADLLDTVCFQVIPMFIDLTLAFVYLCGLFGPFMALILAVTVISYLYITTKLYALRANKRRDYIAIHRKEWSVAYQSLDGWNTASLFNMIPYEQHKYACAVSDHMKAKKAYELSTQVIGATQGLVMTFGLLGALFLAVYQVIYEGKSIGKFTVLLIYWAQLKGPLVFFSTMYKSISYSLMDAERLLELFQTKPTIVEAPHAKPLKLTEGLVKFEGVSFHYDKRKPTLKNVNFDVPPGKTVALVGETGGGKSTILKLLDRFYDVEAGSISIDGQDIRNITLSSLRSAIGVVPQDPTLFNDSIMNNIRYARLDATDQEVYEACKAAAVHEKVMSFPDGYNSKVGDRGVKLSGGEKQRVAIARAILKKPDIILLDEATSAVDTDTEQTIQEGFKNLCKGRTTFVVAHRLSTIMRADRILVIMNGEVVESGSHDELIHSNGKYHDLWSKQIFVKPANERSRSRSPKKQKANIINDLTPANHTIELAKAMRKTDHEEPGQAEADKSDDTSEPASGHKREGSKLKPDAPEFVPGQSKPEPVVMSDLKAAQKKSDKEARKAGTLERKSFKKSTKPDLKEVTSSENQSAGPSNQQPSEGDASSVHKPKPKRTRHARRYQAKSEPASRANESMDGVYDGDMTSAGSGEGQAISQAPNVQLRRVSAPSDPPTGPQDVRGSRVRRHRHWRLKNRAAEDAGSCHVSVSGTTTSGASTDGVTSPTAPITTPVSGVPASGTTVRFAPGC